jgi:CheY-like chemotaxis protein
MFTHPGYNTNPFVMLMIDDDEEDFILVRDALKSRNTEVELYWAADGDEAMDFLRRKGEYMEFPRPHLILLDLHMPGKDGFEVLKDLKADPDLRKVPVVILTSSRDEKHVTNGYSMGASSFILKPITFDEMAETMGSLCEYWFALVQLPKIGPGAVCRGPRIRKAA